MRAKEINNIFLRVVKYLNVRVDGARAEGSSVCLRRAGMSKA